MTAGESSITGGSGGLTIDGGVAVGLCDVGPLEDLPACPDDVATDPSCDGTVPGCVATSSDGETSYYVCEGNGSYFQWGTLGVTTTPCDERESIDCTADDIRAEERVLDDRLSIASSCLGSESYLSVQFVDGCATLYSSSAHLPDQITCIEDNVENMRFSCITRVGCATVSRSTIVPVPP